VSQSQTSSFKSDAQNTDFKDKVDAKMSDASISGKGFLSSFPIYSILIWDVGHPGLDLSSVSAPNLST